MLIWLFTGVLLCKLIFCAYCVKCGCNGHILEVGTGVEWGLFGKIFEIHVVSNTFVAKVDLQNLKSVGLGRQVY